MTQDFGKSIVAIIQARVTSKRFPSKVLKDISGKNSIEWMYSRLKTSNYISKIIFAIPDSEDNSNLKEFLDLNNYDYFEGSEDNVLSRYIDCASSEQAQVIMRMTADCPFIDVGIVDNLIEQFFYNNSKYLSNNNPPCLPDGCDAEIFYKFELDRILENPLPEDIEHVTYSLKKKYFSDTNYINPLEKDYSNLRLTLDTYDDYEFLNLLSSEAAINENTSISEIIEFIHKNSHLMKYNSHHERDAGFSMNINQKFFQRALQRIAGGNLLVSKHPHQFHPKLWPTYFESAKGINILGKDGTNYLDMGMMGIGTNTLGYGHQEVDAAVIETVSKGNLTTLNCFEEVELAEKLIEMNPWAGMCRFARTGGEANAVAVRLARAYSGKDKIAVCGYHGWHDWYLSLSMSNDLDNHLIPGIESSGIPKALNGSVLSFDYNDLSSLKTLVANNEIGAIKMEVMRNFQPKDNFLNKIRKICNENNIVLIFDECSSGFRESYGGLHKIYDVIPDIVVYGKTISNGYALTAVVGTKEIMQSVSNTFISSTFWTERIGNVAALKALEVMQREKSWEYITEYGIKVKNIWKDLSIKNSLEIVVQGLDALATFNFKDFQLERKTILVQELLKHNILGGNAFYPSIAHTEEHLEIYEDALNKAFKKISSMSSKEILLKNIDGGLSATSLPFKRFN
jgi:glutamate-1-semialdehyde aminotransferase/spore coat polysaccharide biosynthesis protein SpsF (cytidylyltransferase family)